MEFVERYVKLDKKISLTFKKGETPTGLSSVGNSRPNTDIKVNKKKVGMIYSPSWRSEDWVWSVGFMVKKIIPDDNPNCDWKWIWLKKKFDTEPEAREYIKTIIEDVMMKYQFHYQED